MAWIFSRLESTTWSGGPDQRKLEPLGRLAQSCRGTSESPLARFASPSLKVEMRDDERVWVGKMPGEIRLQTSEL